MPHINFLMLKFNLIHRTKKISPHSLRFCQIMIGSTALTEKIRYYTLQHSYQQIIQDLTHTNNPNHQLAIELDNLPINLDK